MNTRIGKNAPRARRRCEVSRRMESTGPAVRVSIMYAFVFEDASAWICPRLVVYMTEMRMIPKGWRQMLFISKLKNLYHGAAAGPTLTPIIREPLCAGSDHFQAKAGGQCQISSSCRRKVQQINLRSSVKYDGIQYGRMSRFMHSEQIDFGRGCRILIEKEGY